MSNVIPFPQSEEKIRKQINEAQTSLDLMYDLFEKYEMHFELSEELALKKCWMLHQMSAHIQGFHLFHFLINNMK